MLKRKSGFTLMEIMVVIIVIAVLASVAGPMIGSITDQGRASATKSKLSNLKSALLAYQNDIGRLPVKGPAGCCDSYDADTVLCSEDPEKNALATNESSFLSVPSNYQKRWKGPYMDSDPSDFMYDSWGNKILYVANKDQKNVYLWSPGADGDYYGAPAGKAGSSLGTYLACVEDAFKAQSNENSDCDDIVVSVVKFKAKFKK